jgi:hypothetical protein
MGDHTSDHRNHNGCCGSLFNGRSSKLHVMHEMRKILNQHLLYVVATIVTTNHIRYRLSLIWCKYYRKIFIIIDITTLSKFVFLGLFGDPGGAGCQNCVVERSPPAPRLDFRMERRNLIKLSRSRGEMQDQRIARQPKHGLHTPNDLLEAYGISYRLHTSLPQAR